MFSNTSWPKDTFRRFAFWFDRILFKTSKTSKRASFWHLSRTLPFFLWSIGSWKESHMTFSHAISITNITGNKEMNITYHKRFYDKNEAVVQAVLYWNVDREHLGWSWWIWMPKKITKKNEIWTRKKITKKNEIWKWQVVVWQLQSCRTICDWQWENPKICPCRLAVKKKIVLSTKEQSEKKLFVGPLGNEDDI